MAVFPRPIFLCEWVVSKIVVVRGSVFSLSCCAAKSAKYGLAHKAESVREDDENVSLPSSNSLVLRGFHLPMVFLLEGENASVNGVVNELQITRNMEDANKGGNEN
mmetsp:Transcript_12589/g.25644  ORF Transcript_12589/g.25644 Transcript_12589/m.25644 type:complete len:106 (+) Transcript_12589:1599-1916(+)